MLKVYSGTFEVIPSLLISWTAIIILTHIGLTRQTTISHLTPADNLVLSSYSLHVFGLLEKQGEQAKLLGPG